ncbi:Spy/CpxP family protein refolding chaperone [Celeribacter marinus]|uniref:Spy/CpxP family protein refolding chaperone n=1 Tax=Celeribacter marinus TaxID=1397108 RepID=UPI003F6CDCBA
MKFTSILVAASLVLTTPAFAQSMMTPQEKGLSAPVVALTGFIAKNADALALDEAQRAALKQWLDTMPAKRGALENETAELRAQLRTAIVDNADTATRQALAEQIGAKETQLVLMRSNCVDHWRGVLDDTQFGQALTLAGLKE